MPTPTSSPDWLAVGGSLSSHGLVAHRQIDELLDFGITHIADLRSEGLDADLVAEHAPQITYLHPRGRRRPDHSA